MSFHGLIFCMTIEEIGKLQCYLRIKFTLNEFLTYLSCDFKGGSLPGNPTLFC